MTLKTTTRFASRLAPVAMLTAGVLVLAACGSNNTGTGTSSGNSSAGTSLSGTLTGGGASTQQAAMAAWQAGFTQSQPNVHVQYSPTGSGAGVAAFLAGQQAFANSDKPLSTDEWNQSKSVCGSDGAVNVPVYISPIAVVFNVKGVTSDLKMSPDTIAKIFAGKITTWSDPAIKAENPGVTLPSTTITPVHRADKSGTTFNFTDYLAQTAADAWGNDAAEVWPSGFSGETGQGTSGVVKVVQSTDGAIGYADASAIGDLKSVEPKVGDSYTRLSADAAAKTLDASTKTGGESANDLAYTINRKTTQAGAYPIVLLSYQIFCNTYSDANIGQMAKAWGSYVVSSEGQKAAAAAAGSAPLSSSLSDAATKAIEAIKAGG